MKNCRLHLSRSSNGLTLLMNNVTQTNLNNANPRIENFTLLELFQSCIKEREPYPMIKLTCTGYGKLFENIWFWNFPRNSLRYVTDRFCCSLRPQKFRSQKVESETNSGWCGVIAWRLAVSRSYSGWTRTDILLCRSSHCRSMGSDCISLRGQVSNRCVRIHLAPLPYFKQNTATWFVDIKYHFQLSVFNIYIKSNINILMYNLWLSKLISVREKYGWKS